MTRFQTDLLDLRLGDCMDLMRDTPDGFFDLAIVDPPYGIGEFRNAPWKGKPYNRDWKIGWNDSGPDAEYFQELYRVAGSLIV